MKLQRSAWRELAKDFALAGVNDWGVLAGVNWIFLAGAADKLIAPDDSETCDSRLRLARVNGWRALDERDPEVDAAADLQVLAMEELWSPFPVVSGKVLELRRTDEGGLAWTTPDGRVVCGAGALASKVNGE